MTAGINRRSDTLLWVTSLLPVVIFAIACILLSFNWFFTSFYMLIVVLFATAFALTATVTDVGRLDGIDIRLKTVSKWLSIAGIGLLFLCLSYFVNADFFLGVGSAYLCTYGLVAVMNLGYVVFRRVKRIP